MFSFPRLHPQENSVSTFDPVFFAHILSSVDNIGGATTTTIHTFFQNNNRGSQNESIFILGHIFIHVPKRNETICGFGTYMVYCLPGYEEGFFAFTIQNFVVILGKRIIF